MANSTAKRHVGFCPTCGNTAPQRVIHTHTYGIKWYGDSGAGHFGGPDIYAIYCICETCNAPVLYNDVDPAENGAAWPSLAYPSVTEYGREVPLNIRITYEQAVKCKSHSPIAFAVLIRKAVEGICDDRGIERRGNLQARLKRLAERGNIPPVLAKMTDVLRTLGNAAAHEGPHAVTVPMTWSIEEFFKAVVEYVYVAPARLAEFEASLAKTHLTSPN